MFQFQLQEVCNVWIMVCVADTDEYDATSSVHQTSVSYTYNESVLKHGQLTDQHIDFANGLLRQQHHHIQGLETPLLSLSIRGFSIPLRTVSTVQIHHVNNHWVTSYRAANEDVVYVYDSLMQVDDNNIPILQQSLVTQIRQMYRLGSSVITVGCGTTTQQLNGIDCGVFAIAYATELCEGGDPATVKYNTSQMRSHLIQCFANLKMQRFPNSGSTIRKVAYVDV